MTDAIHITLDDAQARAAFKALRQRLTDMSPLMKKAAGHLADATETAFERETSPDGIPWVDLADRTKAARAKRGKWPGQMLQVSGHLARSVTTDYGEDWAEIGSNLVYARIQQKGGTIHQAARSHISTRQTIGAHDIQIPARPFLGLSDGTTAAIQADMLDWIDLHAPNG